MKFEQVYSILANHQKAINARVVLLTEATLREVYECVMATRSRDCLELGTGHGATTCVIAAALEEIGGGTITTIDHRPDREHNISELAQVTGMQRFDLLVKTHPDLERFALTNTGHIGWARRKGRGPALWLPNGVLAGSVRTSMQQSYDGLPLAPNAPPREGVILEKQERGTLIHATVVDPWVVFSNPVQPAIAIDSLTLRLRLLAPEMETVQLYWIPSDDTYFREEHCQRCIVRASNEPQDLTFAFTGNERERTMRMFRLDPGEIPAPCWWKASRSANGERQRAHGSRPLPMTAGATTAGS